jgi:hypothetical protein
MNRHATVVPTGALGFDCNTPLSSQDASAMVRAGYRYAVRYVPRVKQAQNDITREELDRLLHAGLGIMLVQHVEPGLWLPDAEKGKAYGKQAAASAAAAGYVRGATIWLDLESVATSKVDDETIIKYCNNWHSAAAAAGYEPGIYVGWQCGLDGAQLYRRLRFTRYWGAYNLNVDQTPIVRGFCMRQHEAKAPSGVRFQIDSNVVNVDRLGGRPTACVPDEWYTSL